MHKDLIPYVPKCGECGIFLPYEGALHPERQDCSQRLGEVPQDPVEWTVYSQYAAYPTLYGRSPWSRWFIFNHLFFTIGNGYAWVNGALRDVVSDEYQRGEAIPWRSLEEEEAELLETPSLCQGRDTPGMREIIEEVHQHALATLRAQWAEFEQMPKKWYPVCEYSPIFSLPEHVSVKWLLAACDASQMFWQGSSDGQSLRQLYKLVELRIRLFARLGLVPPSLEETRMTIDLLG